jgi:hypothetical protein
LIAGFWVFTGVAQAIIESGPPALEDMIMAGLINTTAIGVVVAWYRVKIGGIILVLAAIAHTTFAFIAAGRNILLALVISGGPFFIIGILFLLSHWKREKTKTT